MLKVEHLSRKLGHFEMKDVSFSVDEGDYFVLLGASGTGKTVLLETLTGIMLPDSGSIVLRGRDITRERIQKRGIGLIFQNHALFPHMTVRKNIAYGRSARGPRRSRTPDSIIALAQWMGIAHLLTRKPETLSGGESQKVALARILATDPDCLLLDEPLAALDTGARSEIRSLLRKLNSEGMTIIHVTHDFEEAVSLASRIGIMEGGRIIQVDSPRKILMHPKTEFVARFVGIRNLFRGEIVRLPGAAQEFVSSEVRLRVLTDSKEGRVTALVRSEDVIVSTTKPVSSARNVIDGKVADILPAKLGMEVIIEAGTEIVARVTRQSVEQLGLSKGMPVFASIKASAVSIIED